MTDKIITWLHAPGHAGSINKRVIDFALAMEPTVIDWSEMYWNTDDLKLEGGLYHHLIGPELLRDSRNRPVNHDVVISVHPDATIVHHESFWISRAIPERIKYMPQRHGKAIVFDYDGSRVLLVAWHPHPKPTRRPFLVLPVYRRGVRRVQRVQNRLERTYQPDLVLNGGDLQLGAGPTWVFPNRFAERNGMFYQRVHIDWQMWRGDGWRKIKHTVRRPRRVNPKMDHKWMFLTLGKKENS